MIENLHDTTALMSTARSFHCLEPIRPGKKYTEEWIFNHIARGDKLMHILLNRCASAQDASFSSQPLGNLMCVYVITIEVQ